MGESRAQNTHALVSPYVGGKREKEKRRKREGTGKKVGAATEVILKKIYIYIKKWTHAQKQALVLLDGTQAAEEACYHDDGADGDDHVGR